MSRNRSRQQVGIAFAYIRVSTLNRTDNLFVSGKKSQKYLQKKIKASRHYKYRFNGIQINLFYLI